MKKNYNELEQQILKLTEELNHQKNYYENIIAKMPGHVFWKDTNGIFLGCNDQQAKTLGLNSRYDVVGKTTLDMIAKNQSEVKRIKQAQRIDIADQKIIATGKTTTLEEPLVLPNGSVAIYLSRKTPLYNEAGKAIGILGISFDITAEKEAEKLKYEKEFAEKKSAEMKTLAGSIAHELRTPLAAIKHGLEGIYNYFPQLLAAYEKALASNLIEKTIRKDKYQILREILPSISSQADKANLIIDIILKNINDEAINSENFNDCPVLNVLNEAISSYPFSPEEKKLIHCEAARDDFIFYGDPDLAKHVIWNILKNALHFIHAERRGEIYIWTEIKPELNELHIKDTAKGMTQEEANHIFEPFYTNRKGGTGLGLNFCRMVMEAFKGGICCFAKEDEFAEFVLRFPK